MRLVFSLILSLSIVIANAQYGNEWIEYNQNYYSFKIAQNGVYKIDYNALNSAGFPISSTPTQHFQLWGFEQEQALFIEDGGDNSFDPGDYLLFYGKANTTWLD